ncbi:MAG: hypothetical protein VB041_11005, partial [Candidatus Limiplasma sp.]|nr:hypothetical protein [Candidatus Limiplasma sp.]
SLSRVYHEGTDVRALTTQEHYAALLSLFRQATAERSAAEGVYRRLREDGSFQTLRVKITYLSGDGVRSLFFLTYTSPTGEEGLP